MRMVMCADVRQKKQELVQKQKRLAEIQKRIGELDTIFRRIYEDNIIGELSDQRFMKMLKGYEDEQHTLQTEAEEIQNELQQVEKEIVDVKRFIAIVKKYTALTELLPLKSSENLLTELSSMLPYSTSNAIPHNPQI